MATIGELIINVKASTASFAGDLERVKNLSFSTAREIERSFMIIGTAAVSAGAALAGLAAASLESSVRMAAEFGHMAEKAGLTVEAFSGLAFAAKNVNVTNEELTLGLARLSKNMALAESGSKLQADAFKRIGVSVADATTGGLRPMESVVLDLADKFSKLRDGTGKTAEAMTLFGRAGLTMIPFLNLGAEGIKAFIGQAKDLGIIIDEKTAKSAIALEQAVKRLEGRFTGIRLVLLKDLMPALEMLADRMDKISKQNDGVGLLAKTLTGLVSTGSYIVQAFGMATIAVRSFFDVLKNQNVILQFFFGVKKDLKDIGDSFTEWERKFVASMEKFRRDLSRSTKIGVGLSFIGPDDRAALQKFLTDLGTAGFEKLAAQAKAAGVSVETMASQMMASLKADLDFSDAAEKAAKKLADAVKKVTDEYKLQIATIGMTAMQVKLYQFAQEGAGKAVLRNITYLDVELKAKQRIVAVNALLTKWAKEASDAALVRNIADLESEISKIAQDSMHMEGIPPILRNIGSMLKDDIGKSITDLRKEWEQLIRDFGKSAIELELERLAARGATAEQIAGIKALEDQYTRLAAAVNKQIFIYRQLRSEVVRAFEDFIFNGKSFTDVLKDIIIQLGKMLLKVALFGTSGTGGLLGPLIQKIAGIFGGATSSAGIGAAAAAAAPAIVALGTAATAATASVTADSAATTGLAASVTAANGAAAALTPGLAELLAGSTALSPTFLELDVVSTGVSAVLDMLAAAAASAAAALETMAASADSSGGGGGGGIFGLLGGLFGLASGGPVAAGAPIIVGEKGPEIFVPATAGAIVPHGQAAAAGAGSQSVAVTYNIDARGSDPSADRRLRQMLRDVEDRAVKRALLMQRELSLRTA